MSDKTVNPCKNLKKKSFYSHVILQRATFCITTIQFKKNSQFNFFNHEGEGIDRLCGLVVRVPAYRSRGPEFDSRRYKIF
jgi:hypothetical protein